MTHNSNCSNNLLEEYCKRFNIKINSIKKYLNKEFCEIFSEVANIEIPYSHYPLLRFLTRQYTSGIQSRLREINAWHLLFSMLISNTLRKDELPTSLFITTQTYSRGMGYYLGKESLEKNDIMNFFIDLVKCFYKISGQNLYIIICKGILQELLFDLLKESRWDENGFSLKHVERWLPENIRIERRGRILIEEPNVIGFCILNYILSNIKEFASYEDYAKIYYVSKKLIWRRTFFFPNIHRIYKLFYSEDNCYIIKKGKKLYPKLAAFIFSLYIYHKDYRDKVLSNIGKIINLLFNELRIDGKALNDILVEIVKYVKKEKKKKFIVYLPFVLKKLYNNMDYKSLELWSLCLGKYISSKEYREKRNLTEEDSKRIVERIIDELKVEEMQGRFWNKLMLLIKKYDLKVRFSQEEIERYTGIKLKRDLDISRYVTLQLIGDKFYHAKALIISGLLKSL